jgi:hypothetical protein
MAVVGATGLLLIVLSTVVHYEVLRALSAGLPRARVQPRAKLLLVMFAVFAAHAFEIVLYGVAIWLLVAAGSGTLHGDLATLENCLYLSAETYTSLGFGDVVPQGPLRLLTGVETLNGLLLIGWSASYLYIAMERFWNASG